MSGEHSWWMSAAGAVGGGVATVASVVGGWMFKRIIAQHDAEMASLKKGLSEVKEAMAADYVKQETYERNRQEMRAAVIDLHKKVEGVQEGLSDKIDENERAANQRHVELMNTLLRKSG